MFFKNLFKKKEPKPKFGPECHSKEHSWMWKKLSDGRMFNIWQCSKCGCITKTSVF